MTNAFSQSPSKNATYHNQNKGEILMFEEVSAGEFQDDNNGILKLSRFEQYPIFLQPSKTNNYIADLYYRLPNNTQEKLCGLKFQKGQNGENQNILKGHFNNGIQGTVNIKIVKNQNISQDKPMHRFIYAAISHGSPRKENQQQGYNNPQQNQNNYNKSQPQQNQQQPQQSY